MNITFSPVRMDASLALIVSGDNLTINGEAFDFAGVPNGATLPRAAISCDMIAGDVERDGSGVLTVPLILPIGADAPEAARFPAPMLGLPSGPVELSAFASEDE